MRRTHSALVALAATSAILLTGTSAFAAPRPSGATPYLHGVAAPAGSGTAAVCPEHGHNLAVCQAIGVTVAPGSAQFLTTDAPVAGLTPADIQDAYKLPAKGGNGRTIALVEAGDYPHIEADLAVYRKEFGLPPCTTKNGCLTVVNQLGGSDLPHRRDGWSIETALDVDSVSAACPTCHILVVEADDAHKLNLAIGNGTAADLGAVASSNSWKVPEFEKMDHKKFAQYFDAPGVAFTASSGDGGHSPIVTIGFPAGLQTVLAIGGTVLTHDDSRRGWTESAWSGAGSACGVEVEKPSWQKDKGCTMRATADVSADASPASGLAVYHTNHDGAGGWSVYGGTSLSAPLIAAMYGLAGNTAELGDHIASYLYTHADHLYDVTEGSNGTCPPEWPYICKAGPGYDGPTGLGTPHGLGAL